ncbi:hypothetical protein QOZ80_3AG0242570 [Eleusine coracana subsp. coracana]|nr:hypothetical protein QOZ80_3AG0242570 [Eleusine coracana subsp. coracana]
MLERKHAAQGGMGDGRGEKNRRCVVLSLSVLIAATLAFLVTAAFFQDGGLYQWWRFQDGGPGRACKFPTDEAAAGGRGAPTTLSHIVFAIGASARAWNHLRGYVELWWQPGRTRGHVWLDGEPVAPWPAATSPPYRVSADASRYGNRASASRMARIVVDSFLAVAAEMGNDTTAASREDEARWFVMGDHDTVFFPDNVVAVLSKYDHRDPYYIGAPSETEEQDAVYSYGMAFGGGGFAISYAAAAELVKVMDGCLDRYRSFYGSDERVHACLSELGIPLTRELGFHQMDIRDDPYGMLAAHPVAPFVSLHHLDHFQPIIPRNGSTPLDAVRSLVNASQFDPARTLQQSFCYQHGPDGDWSVSIAWGYTAQLYPWIVPAHVLEVPLQTFQTWKRRGPFVFNTRPWRPGNACARPAVFFLSQVRNETGGATVTEYTRVRQSEKECDKPHFRAASAVQTVSVSAPKMSPGDWKRGPRRHCCEMERNLRGSTLDVRIRRCG